MATVRPANPADLGALVALCGEHAAYERAPYDAVGKESALGRLLFGDPPALFAIVVDDDGATGGYATYAPQISTWDSERYLYLDCLYLRPALRGRGLGRRVMSAVAAEAVRLGCLRMQWQTPPFNRSALGFYGSLGATTQEKVRCFLAPEAVASLAALAT